MKIQFGIELTAKQREVYDIVHQDDVKEVVLLFSRQSGKTVLAEIMMMEAALTKPRQTVFYISPTYAQGKKVYREICECLDPHNVIRKKNGSALIIELVNKSVIQFFTTKSPTAIRGNTCTSLLVLDEEAFFPEITPTGENLYHNVIYPITKARKPRIIHISTPSGKNGLFYEKWLKALDPEDGTIKGVKSNIYEDEFISPSEIEVLKANTPALAWRQEFECEFLDSSLTAFEGFERCFLPEKECIIDKGEEVWMGLDFSSSGSDQTIISVINKKGSVWQKRIHGSLDSRYAQLAEIIDSYPRLQCCYAECNSIGEPMINEIKKLLKKNKSKFRPWLTTNESKNNMVELTAVEFSRKHIRIPETDQHLYNELGTFIYSVSKSKRITYAAKPPYHDDRVMALCMSVQAREDFKPFSPTKDTVFIRNRNMSIR